jgi:polygalacturonase
MKKKIGLFFGTLVAIVLSAQVFSAEAKTQKWQYNVCDFGAIADAKTVNTKAFQAAIDGCAQNGGGTVYFPPGKYITGTLYLKNQVHLSLDMGTLILGSINLEDYPFNFTSFPSRADWYNGRALLWAEGVSDISITGQGTIDGRGENFKNLKASPEKLKQVYQSYEAAGRYIPSEGYADRPYLIRFISCRNVRVENVTLRNSGAWMQHYQNCEFVTLRGLNIFNHASPNSDMFDIDGCRNVVINGCIGDSGDDGITFKSTGNATVENVTVSDCIIRSHCNFIKAGTESTGGFKNITITNCVLEPSTSDGVIFGRREGLAGIALECVDGGTLEQVTISNITMRGMTVPLFIRLGNRGRLPVAKGPEASMGALRNVTISNITALGLRNTGASITGIPGYAVQNVTLSNLRFEYVGGGSAESIGKDVPEKEKGYPESHMFGQLPSYGLFCRHVEGLNLSNVEFTWVQSEPRPALICDDVKDLRIESFRAKTQAIAPQVVLSRTAGALLTGCCPKEADVFLHMEKNCRQVSVIACDLSAVKTPFTFDDSISREMFWADSNRLMKNTDKKDQ